MGVPGVKGAKEPFFQGEGWWMLLENWWWWQGGGFQIFYMFAPIWGRFPFWLIFSKGLKPPIRWWWWWLWWWGWWGWGWGRGQGRYWTQTFAFQDVFIDAPDVVNSFWGDFWKNRSPQWSKISLDCFSRVLTNLLYNPPHYIPFLHILGSSYRRMPGIWNLTTTTIPSKSPQKHTSIFRAYQTWWCLS